MTAVLVLSTKMIWGAAAGIGVGRQEGGKQSTENSQQLTINEKWGGGTAVGGEDYGRAALVVKNDTGCGCGDWGREELRDGVSGLGKRPLGV